MRIVNREALESFRKKHSYADRRLQAWLQEAEKASWRHHHDLLNQYRTADILRRGRVVFNIGGNKYRLVVDINYSISTIYIVFIGTHKEYDNINVEKL